MHCCSAVQCVSVGGWQADARVQQAWQQKAECEAQIEQLQALLHNSSVVADVSSKEGNAVVSSSTKSRATVDHTTDLQANTIQHAGGLEDFSWRVQPQQSSQQGRSPIGEEYEELHTVGQGDNAAATEV